MLSRAWSINHKIVKINKIIWNLSTTEWQNETGFYLDVVICAPNYDWQAVARQDVIDELKTHMLSQFQKNTDCNIDEDLQCENRRKRVEWNRKYKMVQRMRKCNQTCFQTLKLYICSCFHREKLTTVRSDPYPWTENKVFEIEINCLLSQRKWTSWTSLT